MGRVIAHAEGAANDLGDAGRGPQVCGESPGERTAQQQFRNALTLPRREFRGAPWDGFRREAGGAVLGDHVAPSHDGTMGTADQPCHLGHAVPSVQPRHRTPSAGFKVSLTAMWSHAVLVRHPMAVRYLYCGQ